MNIRIKEQWIAALRGGEYVQGKNRLRSRDTYCCLGVLCDLHAKETGWTWDRDWYIGVFEHPPAIVLRWAGLSARDAKELALENDLGKSFSEIANMIEKV